MAADIRTDQHGVLEPVPGLGAVPVGAAEVIAAGYIVFTNASGYAVAVPDATCRAWGRCEARADNTSGAAGDILATFRRGAFELANGSGVDAFALADIGSNVYTNSAGTAKKQPASGYAFCGVMIPSGEKTGLTKAGKVVVMPGVPSAYQANPLASGSEFKAHNVATNLAALTFAAAGTFEADANGTLGAQDGITNAVGDTIILPAGTITTGVVSAANSGPYVLTAIGAAGAKFAGRRPSWWADGANVPAQQIQVAAGTLFAGTVWKAYADTLVIATPLVIGVGDPKLCPEKVTQQVTLSSGTITISNVPVFLAARLGFACSGSIGGTAAATTTNFAIKASGGITAGGIGTAAVIVEAQSVSDTIVATDTSVLNVTLMNG